MRKKKSSKAETAQPQDAAPEIPDAAASDEPTEMPEDAVAETAPDPLTELQQQLEAAQARADENHDLYLRTAAELENVRKRAERDATAARKFGVERLASDLLGVRDSLELGQAAAKDENAELKAVVEGIELTLKQLGDTMERYGVTQLDPAGEAFNPALHEAMTMQESAEHAPNTVIQVVQKGYRLHDRLLRPALVVVAKAPANLSDKPGESP